VRGHGSDPTGGDSDRGSDDAPGDDGRPDARRDAGGIVGTARVIVQRIREQDVPFRAAAVTYYALASFVPLLLVSLAVLSLVDAEDALIELLRGNLSGSVVGVLDETLQQTSSHGGAGTVGFLVAAWSATKVFRGLSKAFGKIYSDEQELSLLDQVVQAVVVLAVLLLAVAVASAAGVALAYVPLDLPFAGLLWNGLALVGLAIGLLPLYYVLPPRDVTVRHALPGAFVAAVGWVLLQYGFSIYAQNAGTYAAYGFLGALLLFVLFLYVAAAILLVGGVVNDTLEA